MIKVHSWCNLVITALRIRVKVINWIYIMLAASNTTSFEHPMCYPIGCTVSSNVRVGVEKSRVSSVAIRCFVSVVTRVRHPV